VSNSEGKYESLVDRLIDRTEGHSIQWRISTRSDAFVTVLDRGMIEICRTEELDEEGHPMEWFDLFIMDNKGRVAERLSSNCNLSGGDSTPFETRRLANLFRTARAAAIGTSEVVDAILGDLSSKL